MEFNKIENILRSKTQINQVLLFNKSTEWNKSSWRTISMVL